MVQIHINGARIRSCFDRPPFDTAALCEKI